jgi:hypothetical protein
MPTDPLVIFRVDELIDVFEDLLNSALPRGLGWYPIVTPVRGLQEK